MIGKLLGHTQVQTTARYAHLANESVKASGSRVGDSIGVHFYSSGPRVAKPKPLARNSYQRSSRRSGSERACSSAWSDGPSL